MGRDAGFLLRLGVSALVAGVMLLGWSAMTAGGQKSAALRLGPQVPVTPQDQGLGAADNSPLLATDPGDPTFVALANRQDAPDYSCGLHVSGDGGRGWVPVQPVPRLPNGVQKCYAPEVAIDGLGTIYYLFVGLVGAGNHPLAVFLASSTDRGRTFSAPHSVLGPENFSVRMAIEPRPRARGRLHLVWVHGASEVLTGGFGQPPNPILSASSEDGGLTFSEPVQVSDPSRPLVNAPALVVSADDTMFVAYYDMGDDRRDYEGLEGPPWSGRWSLLLTSSADGGRTFRPVTAVEPDLAPPERVMVIFTMPPPSLAVEGKRVCAAWTDGRNGDPDAYVRCSQDRGRKWSDRVRLNDDPIGTGRSQYLPRVSMSPGGRVDAIFYDRRRDPANANADVSYTFSTDGGRRFSANVALTTEGLSYTQIGQEYAIASAVGMHDFGSRVALVSSDDGVLAAWTDTHNDAPPTKAQDIFATRVRLRDAERSKRVGVTFAGGFAVVLGLAVSTVGALRRRRRGHDATGKENTS